MKTTSDYIKWFLSLFKGKFLMIFAHTMVFGLHFSGVLFYFFFFNLFFIFPLFLLLSVLQMSQFLPLFASLHPALAPCLASHNHHTVVCICGSCIYVLRLIPSSSFIQSPFPFDSYQSVPCTHGSVSIFIF